MPEYDNALIRIVDDDVALCDALRFMLRSEGWRSVVYTSGGEFLEKDDPTVPGVVILDYQMPGISDGISHVGSKKEATSSDVIYDLQGRRVQNVKKGLYIVNGKKCFMK